LANCAIHFSLSSNDAVEAICKIANLADRKVRFRDVLRAIDPPSAKAPRFRHLLLAGPVHVGKSSLATTIGTEYAFALGKCRYLSAVDLVEIASGNTPGSEASEMDLDDARLLWKLRDVELLIVDDVDAAVTQTKGNSHVTLTQLAEPGDLQRALTAGSGTAPLQWLGARRSVWVIGGTNEADAWKHTIATLMNIPVAEILTVELAAQ
jgi:hypothetical protein